MVSLSADAGALLPRSGGGSVERDQESARLARVLTEHQHRDMSERQQIAATMV
jgi:hypothetical protein